LYPKTKDVQLVALVVVIKVWGRFIHVGALIANEKMYLKEPRIPGLVSIM
jgi:hypothetical protein